MRILQVLTSHDQLGNTGRKTGFWLEDIQRLKIKHSQPVPRVGLQLLSTRSFHLHPAEFDLIVALSGRKILSMSNLNLRIRELN